MTDEPRPGAASEQVFAANVETVPEVMRFVVAAARAWDMHPHRLMQLELAIEECVVNICLYAYEVPPGEVLVRVLPEAERFVVELVDEGVPFDPLGVEEPHLRAAAGEREVGGLGIVLVRRVMDEVGYAREAGRNVLRLVIRRT